MFDMRNTPRSYGIFAMFIIAVVASGCTKKEHLRTESKQERVDTGCPPVFSEEHYEDAALNQTRHFLEVVVKRYYCWKRSQDPVQQARAKELEDLLSREFGSDVMVERLVGLRIRSLDEYVQKSGTVMGRTPEQRMRRHKQTWIYHFERALDLKLKIVEEQEVSPP